MFTKKMNSSQFFHNPIRKVTFDWGGELLTHMWERAKHKQYINFLITSENCLLSFTGLDRSAAQLSLLMEYLSQFVILFLISTTACACSLKWNTKPWVKGCSMCADCTSLMCPRGNDGWNRLLTEGWGLWPLGDVQRGHFHFHHWDKILNTNVHNYT